MSHGPCDHTINNGNNCGLCRVVMLMVGADSIRDVIAFPKVKDASCLMMEAPAPVDPKQLEDLDIAIVEKRDEE